ncbi:hypothetical protein CEUSTIGMA_g10156.t1 [Chlamydomonas eustigma]|uniref:EF-hand domain-containing protein n=1 Tax=Chlamydomonas eustigma TaxID=1157962 RepID=A0A250XIV4_9CHLO|nr:hypothetical protein CEUSTIGMA_g10156.t1 [Chlamydomonas eustigma]|eukprot:GAX82730.1 hypothetical protein CEUSTIGMA_g10156.t1 [Chlamydomonas eustigma]
MNTNLQSNPLPSLSTLTGSVRPSTAAAAYEKAYDDQQKQIAKWLAISNNNKVFYRGSLSVPPTSKSQFKPSVQNEMVGGLREAAGRHVSAMNSTPGTPYRRVMSPGERTALQQQVAKKLAAMAARFQREEDAKSGAMAASAAPALELDAPVPEERVESIADPYRDQKLPCPITTTRPSTSIPLHNMVMQRPASRMTSTSNWNGTHTNLVCEHEEWSATASKAGPSYNSHKVVHPMRQSTPAAINVPLNKREMGPPPAPSNGLGRPSQAPLPSVNAGQHQGAGPMMKADPAAGTKATGSGGSVVGTTSRRQRSALENFTPSRGLLYSVFQDLDKLDEGRVTYSMFEEAAMYSGMRQEQVKKLYSMMDSERRGFLTIQDWGRKELWPYMSEFSRLYVQRTRGVTGKYKDAGEIGSLYAALQMALVKLKLKNSGRSVSHERLIQAFSFIDRDSNGSLDPEELQDAFNGLGIYVAPHVIDDAMKTFDRDKSGSVDYSEFISVLFPNLSKGYMM